MRFLVCRAGACRLPFLILPKHTPLPVGAIHESPVSELTKIRVLSWTTSGRPVIRFLNNLRILRVGERSALPRFVFKETSDFER